MSGSRKMVAIAEFSISPIGTGNTSLSSYVSEALKAISSVEGVKYELTPMVPS